MGVVYEAFDREQSALVALKTLRATPNADAGQLKNEFRALADVAHPNLVGLYELSEEDGELYFTMELIDGVPLLEWVWRGTEPNWVAGDLATASLATETVPQRTTLATQPLATGRGSAALPHRRITPPSVDLARLRDAAGQLAAGICALHDAGLLHRDLKPSNVLVTADGRVVILDFGLAQSFRGHATGGGGDGTGRIMGTPPYMAPEQCAGLNATPASDWYGLGGILFHALTGRAPFLGPAGQILSDKQRFEPPPPAQVAPAVPSDLDALIIDLLRRDPRARPTSPEIRRRLGCAPAATAESTHSDVFSDAFVGRARELGVLADALAQIRDGSHQLVRVRGASGSGKSALVHEFLDSLAAHTHLVLRGRCYERESLPYKALDPIMDQLARVLAEQTTSAEPPDNTDEFLAARLFPSLHRLGQPSRSARLTTDNEVSFELRRRAFAAVHALFTRVAARMPTVVFIDDLQWGDADSAPLLDLLTSDRAPPMLVILGFRSESETTNPLVDRMCQHPAIDVEVGPLPAQECVALAEGLLRSAGLPAERAAAIAQEADGHPFFTHELVRLATSGETHLGEGLTVDRAIEQRVRKLPADARKLLAVSAISGRPTAIGVVGAAANLAGAALLNALNLLRARQLVRTHGARETDPVEPYHDRVAETLVATTPDAAARAAHLALAHALLDANQRDPESLARHFLGAGDAERGARYSLDAAAAAEKSMAFARAASLYEQALDHGEFDGPARAELLERMGTAGANAGLGKESAAAFLEAAALTEPGLALDLRRRAAMQTLCSGYLTEGMALLHDVLADTGFHLASTPRRALLRLAFLRARLRLRGLSFRQREASEVPARKLIRADVCRTVAHALGLYDFVRASEFHTRAVLTALDTGDPGRIALAIALDIFVDATGGRSSAKRTQRLIGELDRLLETSSDPLMQAWGHAARTSIRFAHGEFASALDSVTQTLERLRPLPGTDYETTSISIFGLWSLYFLGRWRELEETLRERITEATQRGDLYTVANLRTGVLNSVWLMRDKPARARAELEAAMQPFPDRQFHLQNYWQALAECQTALYEGDHERAWEAISRRWGPFQGSLFMRCEVVRIEARHARGRAAIALAAACPTEPRADQLLREARKAAKRLAREAAPWARALSTLLLASIGRVEGDDAAAVQLLQEGASECEAAGLTLYATAARVRADVWRGEGTPSAAHTAMTDDGVVAPQRMAQMLIP